jgi:hypothetical protein
LGDVLRWKCYGVDMRKIALFAAVVAALVLLGIETWASIRTLAPGELAGSAGKAPMMMTGAKGPPTSLYDDYSIVAFETGRDPERLFGSTAL